MIWPENQNPNKNSPFMFEFQNKRSNQQTDYRYLTFWIFQKIISLFY